MLAGLALEGGGWLLLGLLDRAATLPVVAAQEFAVTLGQMLVGVMCDTLVVETAQLEEGEHIGSVQAIRAEEAGALGEPGGEAMEEEAETATAAT